MKKIFFGGFAAVVLIIIAMNVSNASTYENTLSASAMKCKWEKSEGREVCIDGGDGNTCVCGKVTRPKEVGTLISGQIDVAY
jgi:hypothetical protein